MRFLKTFVSFFSTITVGILIVCAANIYLSPDYQITKVVLPQILLSGFATSLVTTLFFCKDINSRKKFIVISALHYLSICFIMIVLGVRFGWMDFKLGGIIMMVISVAVVYAITFSMNYILAKKDADDINKALERRNKYK